MGGEVRRGELLSSLALPVCPGLHLINRGETSLETRMRALACAHHWSVRRMMIVNTLDKRYSNHSRKASYTLDISVPIGDGHILEPHFSNARLLAPPSLEGVEISALQCRSKNAKCH